MEVTYRAGLRVSEIVKLRPRDVDMVTGAVHVWDGKGGVDRTSYLDPDRVRGSLSAWCVARELLGAGDDDPLFCREDRGGITTRAVQQLVRRYKDEAGITAACTPHVLRHAQPLSEPVLTPDGWVPIGHLQVGDLVIGSSGVAVAVTGVYPKGLQRVVFVKFSDGVTVRCSQDHLWSVAPAQITWPRGPREARYRTMSTSELAQSNRVWKVPLVHPIRFSSQDLPLDPWLLGVLLGDGNFSKHNVVLSAKDVATDELVACALPAGCHIVRRSDYLLYIHGGSRKPHAVKTALRDIGLDGLTAKDKFVPRVYLLSDAKDRLALLQGLLDSDGSCSSTGYVSFTSISKQLASDVAWLTRSLGGVSSIRKRGTPSPGGYAVWRVSVSIPREYCPFRVPRKVLRYMQRLTRPNRMRRRIVGVEFSDMYSDMVCIEVSADDGLYVTADAVLTHNTFASELLEEGFSTRSVQELLGHASVATTEIYTWITPSRLAEQVRSRGRV